MNNFLKIMLACFVAIVIHSIIAFFLTIAIIGGVISTLGQTEKFSVKSGSVLQIDLSMEMPDRISSNVMDLIDIDKMELKQPLTLFDAVTLIEAAGEDPRIDGIYINVPLTTPLSLTSLYELRQAITKFRAAGNKFVIAHGDIYSQGGYYLASSADKIYLNPQGGMDWSGMSSSVMFMKGLFDKLGIEPEIIRHGKFKGAVEPYILTKMSPENRLQMEEMLHSMWNFVVEEIGESRKIATELLHQYASEEILLTPEVAKNRNFIDDLYYTDQLYAELARLTHQEKPNFISLQQYFSATGGVASGTIRSSDHIAVVYAEGSIMDGGDPGKDIIGKAMVEELRKVRKDEKIKAVVLRVNSPGGSVLASDVIWHEMKLLRETKPVIVSMGTYAASGGYYISAPADKIVVAPTTLTGSIGVFGMMFNLERAAREKLGVTVDIVKTNPMADMGSMFRAMTSVERGLMQANIDSIYTRFVGLVADGRGLSYETVDEMAQGRVWSGLQAIELKLADRVGTLSDAIILAAEQANVTNYRIRRFPEADLSFGSLLSSLISSGLKLTKSSISTTPIVDEVQRVIEEHQGVWAKLPYQIDIK